jgi:hypothetical protein
VEMPVARGRGRSVWLGQERSGRCRRRLEELAREDRRVTLKHDFLEGALIKAGLLSAKR